MAKSYRTAFIRVTSENDTKEGVIVYNKNDINIVLKSWSESANITYWFIEHSADEEVSKTHYHIVIKFKSPMPFDAIKSKFPYGNIESARNVKATIQYLIHYNDKSKVQYIWEDIETNCLDMTPYKIQSNSQQEITIQNIIERIDNGEIKEYNQFTIIPIELWSKHKGRIENALTYYRERVCMDKNRTINVIFLSGDTGTGKTSFAKRYCEGSGKSYCVTSSSNDPMQDYKGEDVLIMDDLRDEDYKFTDLLKILDNHTNSTVKSRYHNKAFIGDTIIITSYKPLNDWYFNVPSESKHQLYRRIKCMYKFTEDRINAFQYNEQSCRYESVGSTVNIILQSARKQAEYALGIFDAMGIEYDKVEDVRKAIKTYTEDEWKQAEIDNLPVDFNKC